MISGQILHDPYEPIIIFQVVNKIEYNFELVKKTSCTVTIDQHCVLKMKESIDKFQPLGRLT